MLISSQGLVICYACHTGMENSEHIYFCIKWLCRFDSLPMLAHLDKRHFLSIKSTTLCIYRPCQMNILIKPQTCTFHHQPDVNRHYSICALHTYRMRVEIEVLARVNTSHTKCRIRSRCRYTGWVVILRLNLDFCMVATRNRWAADSCRVYNTENHRRQWVFYYVLPSNRE